jgi:transcriptional regulator with XRE-family HTH domain
MGMAVATNVELQKAKNLRANLRRIFSSGVVQAKVARDAGMNPVNLSLILHGKTANPSIGSIEQLAIALEIPVEILISANPTDVDLRIFQKST